MKIFNITIFFCVVLIYRITSAPTADGGNNERLTGNSLIKIGSKLNKPFLKLIGKTMNNLENEIKEMSKNMSTLASSYDAVVEEICRLHPCEEWSQWSKCDANKAGEFGGQNRTRNCGLKTTFCERINALRVEIDTRVCERSCPLNYTVSKHGFCLKLYADEKERDDAEKVCQTDGGHLVNVDSDIKVEDVNKTLLDESYQSGYLWIDGQRSVQGGPWKYGYATTDPNFTFWGQDDPDNGATDLCIYYHKYSSEGYSWRWFDGACYYKRGFICQIVQ